MQRIFILVSVILLYYSTESAAQGCSGTKYSCPSDPDTCVKLTKMCDGVNDCPDGKDENTRRCKQHCNDIGRWWCGAENKCLEYTELCDGEENCMNARNPESLDERRATCLSIPCTGAYTRCGSRSLQCIRSGTFCDGNQDCDNGWDEASCDSCEGVWNSTIDFTPAQRVLEWNGRSVCNESLRVHNYIRSLHSRTPALQNDVQLVQSAEEKALIFAQAFAHGGEMILDAMRFTGDHSFEIGEMWAIDAQYHNSNSSSISDLIFNWYEEGERCGYNYDTGVYTSGTGAYNIDGVSYNCGAAHSFPQVLWGGNRFVGCGAASITVDADGRYYVNGNATAIFFYCHYLVKEFEETFTENVAPLRDSSHVPTREEYENRV